MEVSQPPQFQGDHAHFHALLHVQGDAGVPDDRQGQLGPVVVAKENHKEELILYPVLYGM